MRYRDFAEKYPLANVIGMSNPWRDLRQRSQRSHYTQEPTCPRFNRILHPPMFASKWMIAAASGSTRKTTSTTSISGFSTPVSQTGQDSIAKSTSKDHNSTTQSRIILAKQFSTKASLTRRLCRTRRAVARHKMRRWIHPSRINVGDPRRPSDRVW